MVWELLGTTTLGSAGDTIDVTIIPKQFLFILCHTVGGDGNIKQGFRCGSGSGVDTGNNYVYRYELNTGGSNISINQVRGLLMGITTDKDSFSTTYISNINGEEKLIIANSQELNSADSGTAPDKFQVVAKWTDTNQITEFQIYNTESGNFNTNSICTIYGTD